MEKDEPCDSHILSAENVIAIAQCWERETGGLPGGSRFLSEPGLE